MIKRLLISIICLICFFNINVFALESEEHINPEWLKYIKLTEEEQSKYLAVPEKYIVEYKDEKIKLRSYSRASFASESLPSYFNLTKYNNKTYVNSISENQGSLGLCWAFAAIGSTESNILLNGVKGLEEKSQLCDINDLTSLSCSYKNDGEINNNYSNHLVDKNAGFSENVINYMVSKPKDTSAYFRSGIYTVVSEEYNPYTINNEFGAGGSFSNVGNYYSYGIAPTRKLKEWTNYTTSIETKSLYQIFDSVDNDYQVTDYYNYPYVPSNSVQKTEWINKLKQLIMEYGSAYISIVAPSSGYAGSCYYYDKEYNIDGEKQYIHLINYQGNCGTSSLGWHAMQLIGWDDNYTFAYCKAGTVASTSYNKQSCKEAGYSWTEGTGAWILKNSWGSSYTYPYLSYQSTGTSISGVRSVEVKDYDNAYDKVTSIINQSYSYEVVDGKNISQRVFNFRKPDGVEYLTSFNVYYSSSGGNYQVSVSNDGVNYEIIDNGVVDYTGIRTYYPDNYQLNGKDFYIKVVASSVSYVNAFTKNECTILDNCDENMHINTVMDKTYYDENNVSYKVFNNTTNIKSGSRINYKVYKVDLESNTDVTNSFIIPTTYVVNDKDSFKMYTSSAIEKGLYKLVSTYTDEHDNIVSSECDFGILGDEIVLSLIKPVNTLFKGEGPIRINYNLSTSVGVNSYNWMVEDTSIATVDSAGNLTLLNSGKTTVRLELDTIYGEVSDEIEIVVYDKISTVDEFLNMFIEENNTKAYYLMNDLDFSSIDLSGANYFKGIFQGNYHEISNVIRNGDIVGLFPYLENAEIRNIIIKDSSFTGTEFVGSVSGYAENSIISGIKNEANVTGNDIAGGIVGYLIDSSIIESYNGGIVSTNLINTSSYTGGISGRSYEGSIENTFNQGEIISVIDDSVSNETTLNIYSSGIVSHSVGTIITNVYNVGVVNNKITPNDKVFTYKSGISDEYINVNNSYYIKDNNYNIIDESKERSIEQLRNSSNYLNWDFNNIWQILEGKSTPVLKKYPIDIKNIVFNLFSNVLNTNSEYEFSYEIIPLAFTDEVEIISQDTELFTINGNKIITGNKTGISNITFIAEGIEYNYSIEVMDFLTVEYDKTLTRGYVDVNINYKYYFSELSNQHIKVDYSINGDADTHSFEDNVNTDKYTIRVDNNGELVIKLYVCDSSSCSESIVEKRIIINNIDKTRPVINYYPDNIKKTLNINITDDNGLSPYNDYSYGLSSSNSITPLSFNKYNLNNTFSNLLLSNENYYLWVKRVFDKSGNALCDTPYCIYRLSLENNYYNIVYYDENKTDVLKTEKILENSIINPSFIPTKDSTINFDYVFDEWIGYTTNMKSIKDLTFYAKYKGYFRGLNSSSFIIEDNYIKGIKPDTVSSSYSIDKFISNISSTETYNFYDSDIIYPDIIKTGLIYKSDYRTFKIVLTGDVTGDGLIKMNDVMKIANEIVNKNVLKEEFFYAGDVTGDNKIKMNDVMKIASGLVNGGSL